MRHKHESSILNARRETQGAGHDTQR